MELEYNVKSCDNNKTIKDILLTNLHVSHRLLITLKKNNCIYLNNLPAFVYNVVSSGDIVKVSLNYEEDSSNIPAIKMDLDIIYEDDWYLVINKPSGIPVHPSFSHYKDSLSSGVKFYFDSIGLKKKIRPVNRIDKDTSGLVVFAKNEYIQECLINQMKNNQFYKEYLALCEGVFENKKDVIDLPITRKENSIIERCVRDNGDNAITHYEVLKEVYLNNEGSAHCFDASTSKNLTDVSHLQCFSVVKCILKTGRTHQIRVHMSHIGHPLLGDDLYGGSLDLLKRQALHSYKISFIHPITQQKLSFEATLPNDMLNLMLHS